MRFYVWQSKGHKLKSESLVVFFKSSSPYIEKDLRDVGEMLVH